jgi:hypothetical protein
VFNILRHGMPTLKNAVAGGQYDFPKGLFFGGSGPSATQQLMAERLPGLIGSCKRVVHVDFHTGLGKRGTYKLFVDHTNGSDGAVRLGRVFGPENVESWDPGGVSYAIRGGLGVWCKSAFEGIDYDVLAAEFGTVHVLKVISALHMENRATQWGDPDHPRCVAAHQTLRDTFAPADEAWRDLVVGRGLDVVGQALACVAEGVA